MKKILILFTALLGMTASQAQQSGGDYFEGLSRKIGFSRTTRRCTSSFPPR